MAMEWFRWHHGTVTDPKWRVIAKRSGFGVSSVIAVFAFFLERASQAEDRGSIYGWCAEDIGAALDLDADDVVIIFTAMQGKILDGDRLTGWEKRQPKREDCSAERAKAWREQKKTQTNATERTQTQTNTDKIRLDKIRLDKKDSPPFIPPLPDDEPEDAPANAVAKTNPRQQAEKPTKGTRLPSGSLLPDDWRKWALDEGTRDPERTWAKFADYWSAKPGATGVKLNWFATWRNWCRNDKDRGGGGSQSGPQGPGTLFDAYLSVIKDLE